MTFPECLSATLRKVRPIAIEALPRREWQLEMGSIGWGRGGLSAETRRNWFWSVYRPLNKSIKKRCAAAIKTHFHNVKHFMVPAGLLRAIKTMASVVQQTDIREVTILWIFRYTFNGIMEPTLSVNSNLADLLSYLTFNCVMAVLLLLHSIFGLGSDFVTS